MAGTLCVHVYCTLYSATHSVQCSVCAGAVCPLATLAHPALTPALHCFAEKILARLHSKILWILVLRVYYCHTLLSRFCCTVAFWAIFGDYGIYECVLVFW